MRILPVIFVAVVVLIVVAVWWQRRDEIRYVPLGDSYTIGTNVNPADNFPAQLTRDLNAHGVKVRLVTNPAHNGWTTQDLIDYELPIWDRSSPALTTLLIGVNDFNRGVSIETFHKNLKIILDHIQKSKVILITIPDFSVTVTGKNYGDPAGNSAGIKKFNEVIKAEGAARKIPVVDIFTLSQDMGRDPRLVTFDNLHPSPREYALWEKLIFNEYRPR